LYFLARGWWRNK
jgi:hypothetical protein